jgi:hypothetical protein
VPSASRALLSNESREECDDPEVTLSFDSGPEGLLQYFDLILQDVIHAVAQLVEALRYKPESCGFDSRWCH